jgi:DMSO/TMAO reductase YedYZ molybdopterin-dependent catalytic subunit
MRFICPTVKMTVFLLILLFISTLGCGCGGVEEVPAGTVIIEGDAVEAKVSLTLEELKAMDEGLVEDDYFSINSYGTREHFHFKGVWVWHLISETVSLKDRAAKVSFIAEDGYTVEYTLEDVQREDYIDEENPGTKLKLILAWEEDGEEFDPKQGNPYQVVVGQREPGDVNKPYWVRHVKTIRID